ncbi:MAG TPA: 4-(cytidine 5'-diphospho)-2-C-methyl-D-erythritol kinase [Longimicrobiaceae bacterium]|nr:4-(cytidine 5'-diphospho)-2-C-methyl-D-erythritol kinase [Longimicrobiaceae bacterium]
MAETGAAAPVAVTLDAPAKVNLRLCILAREESGYHALETIFCAVSLADEVQVRRGAPGMRLSVEGDVDAGPPERNLVRLAAERFYRALGEEPAVDLRLTKRIPAAAGLGGGSSDAAATLRALNALHGGPFPRSELLRLAAELGADVPFFVCGSPLALAWGRGERVMPLPPLVSLSVLVAHPGVAMPTADAFARIAEARGPSYRPVAALIEPEALASWEGIAALAGNDFEGPGVERVPVLGAALGAMRSAGIALLAGSGSSVFGIFTDEEDRDQALAEVEALGMRCWRAATLGEEPAPRLEFPGAGD